MNGGSQCVIPRVWRVAAVLTFAAAQLFAANQPTPRITMESPSTLFSMFRVFGALLLVIALFMGGLWLFRNWQRFTVRNGKAPRLRVLEVRSLGPRHSLHVVAYDRQRFLVSSAPSGINLISSLPEGELQEHIPPSEGAPAFAQLLAKALGSVGKKGGVR